MKGLIVKCVAAMFMDGTPDTQTIPPLVKGVVVREFVLPPARDMWQVEFKDLIGRPKVLAFEANHCRIESGQ